MNDVFISYVEADADLALQIALGLEERTWCYGLDSLPGPSYLIQTGRAINNKHPGGRPGDLSAFSRLAAGGAGARAALEAGKDCLPVLREITHIEFQNRQPEWREALGQQRRFACRPRASSALSRASSRADPGTTATVDRKTAIRAFLDSLHSRPIRREAKDALVGGGDRRTGAHPCGEPGGVRFTRSAAVGSAE